MNTDIKTLVEEHFKLAPSDFEAWLQILQDDIVMDMPYGPSAGFPASMKGKEAIRKVIPPYFARLPGLTFDNWKIFPCANPHQAYATYTIDRIVADNGRRYQQQYVCYFVKTGDTLSYIAEYFDTVKTVAALSA